MSIDNYSKSKSIYERRTAKKCPILSFKPIRESEVYKDMIDMGFTEVILENPIGIQTIGTQEERYFKDRLGNIAFFHKDLEGYKKGFPYYNIKHNGSIKVCTGPSKSMEFPYMNDDIRVACMTIDDYLFKMGFLIKYLIKRQGFPVSNEELNDKNETYDELIKRNIEKEPELVKKIKLPQSVLKKSKISRAATLIKRFGGFDDLDSNE